MKKIFYFIILATIVGVIVSDEIRHKVFRSLRVAKNTAEQVIIRGNNVEIRVLDEGDFDNTINEPRRLVVVFFQHELTPVADYQSNLFNERVNDLPGKVLVVKVQKEQNEDLFRRLGISKIPTFRVYREGEMLKEYEGPVDEGAFFGYINGLLKD